MNTRKFFVGLGLVSALALTACGGGNGGGATASSGGTAGGATTLEVSADPGGALAFQPTSLEAAANQAITVNFKNPAPLQHNWVLVKPGQEQAVVDAAAAKAGDATGDANAIAAGALLNANGNETINVPAQPAGTYTYVCTVPGHYAAGMKGTLTVK